jgi:hypothetical protein
VAPRLTDPVLDGTVAIQAAARTQRAAGAADPVGATEPAQELGGELDANDMDGDAGPTLRLFDDAGDN